MTEGSRLMLYLLFGVMGFAVLLILFSLGPLGWFLTAFLIIAAIAYFGRDDGENLPERTNCPACGAPNLPDHETCEYCGGPL